VERVAWMRERKRTLSALQEEGYGDEVVEDPRD
jgi:hypothetical protein